MNINDQPGPELDKGEASETKRRASQIDPFEVAAMMIAIGAGNGRESAFAAIRALSALEGQADE